MKRKTLRAVMIVVGFYITSCSLCYAQLNQKEYIEIPVLVNVLKGVKISNDDLTTIFKAANAILRPSVQIELQFNAQTDIIRDVPNGAPPTQDNGQPSALPNSGYLLAKSRSKVDDAGLKELKDKNKAYKVTITKGILPTAGQIAREVEKNNVTIQAAKDMLLANTMGQSYHIAPPVTGPTTQEQDATHSPLTYLKYPPEFKSNGKVGTLTNQQVGHVLAHEFCHAFTLGAEHTISESDKTKADATGHDPDTTSLMYAYPVIPNPNGPGFVETGTTLAPAEQKEVQNTALANGGIKKENVGNTTIPEEFIQGSWVGTPAGGEFAFHTLASGSLYVTSTGPESELVITSNLGGTIQPENVNLQYSILFNTDNKGSTGVTVGSFRGIDKEVIIQLQGRYPFTGSLGTIKAYLADFSRGAIASTTPLAAGSVNRFETIFDTSFDLQPFVEDYYDSLTQGVPLRLLGPLASVVPMGIIAIDARSGTADQVAFAFDFAPPPGPLVTLSFAQGSPRETDTISGIRFTPDSPITILINDTPIGTAETDSAGSFRESFTIPELPNDNYFVTARDGEGRFDFSILTTLAGAPDFTISASPSSETVVQGASTNYTVSIGALNGFTGSVTMSDSGLPTGANGTFTPNPPTATSTLKVTTLPTTPTGTYTFTITGMSGTLLHTYPLTLVVSAGPQQSLALACPAGLAQLGIPFTSAFVASGGNPPYSSFRIAIGELPAGLSLNASTGAVTGTPTAVGATFIGQVTDFSGLTVDSPGCFF